MEIKEKIPDWILLNKAEEKLSIEEKSNYYNRLREYCKRRKLINATRGATTIAPKLKRPTEKIARGLCKILAGGPVEVITDGIENIPDGPVIFASTHQGIMDNFVWIPNCPKHAIILHSAETNKALLLAQLNTGLILVTKDKENIESRRSSKLDMLTVLLNGHSVNIFPETTWNLSPNRLHLPLNFGFLDVARITGLPVVPLVIEYTYDTSSEKERITRVHIRYGAAIIVKVSDGLKEKLKEYEEIISTIRWELIEEKGTFPRHNISNYEYINFVKGNLNNLKLGKVDIERERNGIQGANQEFYLLHHINDVPWNERGELLGTSEAERLKRINFVHGIARSR